jgi:hypothetical protein
MQTATPTVLDRTTVSLTPRRRLAVQLSRVRGIVRGLNAADRAWAADALIVLLADCRDAVPANMKGARE